jgi:hypothetical protein
LLNNFTLSGVQLSLFRSTYLEPLAILLNYYIRFLKTATMQFITAITAAAVMAATVSARSAVTLGKSCDFSKPHAKVINRCPYKVNLWSIYKLEDSGTGCPVDDMVTLQPGDTYSENYQDPNGGGAGVSIKLSKTEDCPKGIITQLEYFIEATKPGFNNNFLDVSYVDCSEFNPEKCPAGKEGFFLAAGTAEVRAEQPTNPNWCPAMSCWDRCSCGDVAYMKDIDDQTKTCRSNQNMELYLCGTEADADPDTDYSMSPLVRMVNGVTEERMNNTCVASSSSIAPATTLHQQTSAAPKPTETQTEESYGAGAKIAANKADIGGNVAALKAGLDNDVAAAAVTTAPKAELAEVQLKTKTEVVYVTAYQTVNVKRHAHGHARRHAANNA